jgi:microcystin degradation protein MlrC
MSRRIGIAGFMHESNTFATTKTSRTQFEEAFFHKGADLVPVWEEAHHELGGFIEGCATYGLDGVPTLAAWATPGGTVTDAAYESIVEELLEELANAGPLDGLLLALHGAMVTETHDDADGETLERVRALLGPDVPIVLSLDMHGNVSPRMAKIPDVLVAYQSYPHIDQRERGVDCARILADILSGDVHPCQAHLKLPLLIHIVQQYTGDGPMAELYAELSRIEEMPEVVSVSLLPGYIYADSPFMGVSALVATNGDSAQAEVLVESFGAFVYERREALNAGLPTVDEAVREAIDTEGTVCLMDSGDNIGGGGPGDSTILLAALRAAGATRVCVTLYDPEVADTCYEAGMGKRLELVIGAKTDRQHGDPVAVSCVVQRLSDGKFVETEARHGGTREYDQGRTAALHTTGGHKLVVNSLRVMPTSLEQLLSLGIDPTAMEVIIVKGVTAPRAAYEPIAAKTICVDTPGVTRAGPDAFVYKKRPQPLFPLD